MGQLTRLFVISRVFFMVFLISGTAVGETSPIVPVSPASVSVLGAAPDDEIGQAIQAQLEPLQSAFPPLLTKMNNELEWTQKLGDAFLIQEAQLMSTVQALRERAYAAGHLKDQEHITVQRQEKVIVIEPRTPEVVYVPVYDTRVVYGNWMWREYPPIHWPYPDYYSGGSYVYWGVGARVTAGAPHGST